MLTSKSCYNAPMSHGEDKAKRDRIIRIVAERLGVSEQVLRNRIGFDFLRDVSIDSLDVEELILELEEEFGDELK